MRLRPEKIEALAETVYDSLVARPDLKPKGSRSDLVFEISTAITEDLEEEDAIEREARALLEKHADDLRRSGLRSDEALKQTIRRIARERKFTL